MTISRGLTLIVGALGALAFAAPSFAADNATQVQIDHGAFTPSSVRIAAGGSVSWVNRDTVDHRLSAPDAKLDSPTLTPTDSFAFTFPTTGTFTVTDSTGLTMTVVVGAAEFGTWTKVLGNLDPGSSGQKVTVQQQACGNQTWTRAKTVATRGGGSFAASVRPRNNTVYRVTVGSSKATVAVHVTPKLVLRKLANGRYKLTVNGPATGSRVSIQTRSGSHWKIVTTVRVQGASKLLTLNLKRGTTVRASMSEQQAGQCLDAGVSNRVIA
jgi:plastocyanin